MRLSESTYKEFQSLSEIGTAEDVLSNLITTYKRTSLETDNEFGSQLSQVNSLTVRIGEIFESIVKQSNTKSEIQESEKVRLEENYKDQLFESHSKIKELKEELQLKLSDTKLIMDKLRVLQENDKKKSDQIIGLEKQIRDFDERIEELKDSSKEKDGKIDELLKEIDSREELVSTNKELNDSVVALGGEIKVIQENQKKELNELSFEHEKALFAKGVELQESFQTRVDKIQDKFNQQLIDLTGTIKQLQIENSELKLISAITSSSEDETKYS